jgi:outer membrane protein TolC
MEASSFAGPVSPRPSNEGRLALQLSRGLYLRGLAHFLTVLDNERSLHAAEDQLVQSDRTRAVSLIALYKALGGGWDLVSVLEEPR